MGALIYEKVRRFVVHQPTAKSVAVSEKGTTTASELTRYAEGLLELRDERVAAELARLDRAYAQKVLYIVGKG